MQKAKSHGKEDSPKIGTLEKVGVNCTREYKARTVEKKMGNRNRRKLVGQKGFLKIGDPVRIGNSKRKRHERGGEKTQKKGSQGRSIARMFGRPKILEDEGGFAWGTIKWMPLQKTRSNGPCRQVRGGRGGGEKEPHIK